MLSVKANCRLASTIGILLPAAEMLRRSDGLGSWWLWVDDWLIGGSLLLGAWAARARRAGGLRALAAAWGVAAGMGWYSLVGHLQAVGEKDVSGLPGWALATVIAVGWLIVLYGLASTLLADRR